VGEDEAHERTSPAYVSVIANKDKVVPEVERKALDEALDITQLLTAWCGGDRAALEQLAPVLQQELHRVASRHLAGERSGHSLQATALVNEAYLRLIDWKNVSWQNRGQFFAMASRIMRQILIDYARAQHRAKRGGGAVHVSLSRAAGVPVESLEDLIALDEALQKLQTFAPRQSRIVELRFFGGLSLQETAEVLEVSVATVRKDWSLVRAWLYRELTEEGR
jgi:RNA polymerase sigma factor (TIGR02999 family)